MNRFALLLIGVIVYSCSLYGQDVAYIPKKYYKPVKKISWRPYSFRDSLLEENQSYVFTIKKIVPMKDGFLLRAKTVVDNQKIFAVIISPFNDYNNKSSSLRPLRVNKKYSLSIQRYYQVPVSRLCWNSVSVADILLGNKTISVYECGFHWYLFTSMNLCGLSIRENTEVDSFKDTYSQDSILIKKTLDSFIRYVCFQKTQFTMIDTTSTKHSFLKYGIPLFGRSPFELDSGHYNKRKWYIDSIPPLLDWTNHPYNLDTCNFKALFQYILEKECLLPVSDTLEDDIKSICYKLLYYEPMLKIFTIQLQWEIPALDKTYFLIVNVQKQDGQYKICGLNKPYHGYSMGLRHNNYFIERKKKAHRLSID